MHDLSTQTILVKILSHQTKNIFRKTMRHLLTPEMLQLCAPGPRGLSPNTPPLKNRLFRRSDWLCNRLSRVSVMRRSARGKQILSHHYTRTNIYYIDNKIEP